MSTLITLNLIARKDIHGYEKGDKVYIINLNNVVLTKDKRSHFIINLKDWYLETVEHKKNGTYLKRRWKSQCKNLK